MHAKERAFLTVKLDFDHFSTAHAHGRTSLQLEDRDHLGEHFLPHGAMNLF
jgi:hypothetical protein